MRPNHSLWGIIGCVMIMTAGAARGAPEAGSRTRRVHAGDPIPEVSVVDMNGQTYTGARGTGRVLMVAFLSAEQLYSSRAQADLEQIIGQLGGHAKDLDLIVCTNDPNAFAGLASPESPFKGRLVKTLDKDSRLWGRFGAIAIPTVVICGKDDKVLWVEAGYGYDFKPVLFARLNQALGIAQKTSPDAAGDVHTLASDTADARVKRLVQAADLMTGKGHVESAITELEKARQLDPNAVEVLIRLGEIYCKKGKGLEALQVLEKREGRNRTERSRLNLILGWAYRQVGDTASAEKALLRAVELDPRSARALLELGRVYEKQGRTDKALDAYRTALATMLGEA